MRGGRGETRGGCGGTRGGHGGTRVPFVPTREQDAGVEMNMMIWRG